MELTGWLFLKEPVSRRSTTVKLAVGLVMKHAVYNYHCAIVDWDAKCLASDEWIGRMRVHELARGPNQPFYHVLVDDGTHRYAAEGALFEANLVDCYGLLIIYLNLL